MSHLVRAIVVLLALLASFLVPSVAHAKDRKPAAVKVHMCESVDVYTGAVDANHAHTRIAESCRDVSPATAQRSIDKCTAKADASVCEVLYSADKKTLFIESKIVVTARGGK